MASMLFALRKYSELLREGGWAPSMGIAVATLDSIQMMLVAMIYLEPGYSAALPIGAL
jgi:hypothetical protein